MRQLIDLILAPIAAVAVIPLKIARKSSMVKMPLTAAVFKKMGVFPIVNHYYEPKYDMSDLTLDNQPRNLPGIDFRHNEQIKLLESFNSNILPNNWNEEAANDISFSLHNPNFGAGDADLWFHIINHFKPKKIIEIGSGRSTLVAREAVATNIAGNNNYQCEHICIEPYEMTWLEKLEINIYRSKLEELDSQIFETLSDGDILFIDSSHIIRPGGEVLMEFLEILPQLASGVIVHVHDIFTPRDYPEKWLKDPRFWNEQYLLEAFLSHNSDWEILIANNYLAHDVPELMEKHCRYFVAGKDNPGSFYMRRK